MIIYFVEIDLYNFLSLTVKRFVKNSKYTY